LETRGLQAPGTATRQASREPSQRPTRSERDDVELAEVIGALNALKRTARPPTPGFEPCRTDNIRLLETLERHRLLPGDAAADLTETYKSLRAAYHRSALQEQPKTVPDDQLLPERERVQALWGELLGD
jgi:hypothetical protein